MLYGNEWYAGNLSYHLKSRPIWSPAMTIIKFGGFVMIGEEFKNCEDNYNEPSYFSLFRDRSSN